MATSWNGIPLKNSETKVNDRWFNSLPRLQMSDHNFVDWFREEEDLITTRIKLFNKDTLSKVLWLFSNFSEVEDLLAKDGSQSIFLGHLE